MTAKQKQKINAQFHIEIDGKITEDTFEMAATLVANVHQVTEMTPVNPVAVNTYEPPTMLSRSGWNTYSPTNWAELKALLAGTGLDRSSQHAVIYLDPAVTYAPAGSSFDTLTIENHTGDDTYWLYIMPKEANYSSIATEGTRVDTSNSTETDAMPLVRSRAVNCPTFSVPPESQKIRFVGLEITHTDEFATGGIGRMYLGGRYADGGYTRPTSESEWAQEIVVDRCWVHGHNTWTIAVEEGIVIEALQVAIIESQLEWFRSEVESHAVLSPHGARQITIWNCFIDAGIGVLTGGAGFNWVGDQTEDLDVRYCEFYPSPMWDDEHDDYEAGTSWHVKNFFETKCCVRCYLAYNWMHDLHEAFTNQGFGEMWKAGNQFPEGHPSTTPWRELKDIRAEWNEFRNSPRALAIVAADGNRQVSSCKRITIQNNLFVASRVLPDDSNEWDRIASLSGTDNPSWDPSYKMDHIVIDQNTLTGRLVAYTWQASICLEFGVQAVTNTQCSNFTYTNNVTECGQHGIKMTGVGGGETSLNAFADNWTVEDNVGFNKNDSASFPVSFPRTNLLADITDVGFAQTSDPDGSFKITGAYSAYGCDYDTLIANTAIAHSGVRF